MKETTVDTGGRDDVPTLSCCERLMAEIRCPLFGLEEPHNPSRSIDLIKTFQPQSVCASVAKIFFAAFSVGSLVQLLVWVDRPKYFWFAYLSNWSFLMAILYLLLSCLWVFWTPRLQSVLLKLTWLIYPVAASAEILVSTLFWILDFDPKNGVQFGTFTPHGVVMTMVLIDGAIINRIPIRAKQYIAFAVYQIVYILWSILHAVTNIGNPFKSDQDPNTDDDAIYGVYNWNKRMVSALILALVVVLLVSPLFFLLVWSLSAFGCGGTGGSSNCCCCCCCRFDGSNRRYITTPSKDNQVPYTPSTDIFDLEQQSSEQQQEAAVA